MNNLNYTKTKKSFSFQINQKPRFDKEFHFTGKDKFFGFEGEADLVIKSAPIFLVDVLAHAA